MKDRIVGRIRRFTQRFIGFDPEVMYNTCSLEQWFYGWIVRQNTFARDWSPRNIYYEFGVGGGGSLIQYIRSVERACQLHHFNLSDFYIYGFDSFAGLPEKAEKADDHPSWEKDVFNHPLEEVQHKIQQASFPLSNTRFVRGYYEDSLTAGLQQELGERGHYPSIVTVDCDYYSSAKLALEFLKPLLRSGAVFYFDDIWSFHGHPEMGELKAINEFNCGDHGSLTPCHLYGLEHYSFIYSAKDWEYGNL